MSKTSCTFIPVIGKKLMDDLRRQFGYKTARKAFLSGAVNPKFLKDYAHSLVLDAEGVPTFESFMAIPYVQEVFIGENKMLSALNKDRVALEDSIENYESLLNETFSFNTTGPYRDSYVASVVYTEDNKLKVEISHRTDEKLKMAQNEYRQFQINKRLANIFSKLGVTIGALSKVEQEAGRVGVTDFTVADQLAQDFVSMIRVANNREGAKALSEEFAHLIIGCMKDNPLIARSINFLKGSTEALKTILGNDYDDVVTSYEGNMDLVAEEALGHILKQNLIDTSTDTQTLFGRTITNVRQQFKKYDENSVDKALEEVNKLMETISKEALQGSLPIDKEKIANSKRQVKLNALSDRVARNLETIKKAKEVEIKRLRISSDGTRKEWAENNLETLKRANSDELSQLEALSNYTQRALQEMKNCFDAITAIGTKPKEQAFATLRYVRGFIASYGNFIDSVNNTLNLDKEDEDSAMSQSNPIALELKDSINQLAAQSRELTAIYATKAHSAFCDFLRSYLGDNVILKMKGPKGVEITVEELLNSADKDISLFDRWLDSMGDSADVLLQMFDQVVKQTKDSARLKTMDAIREITALRQEAENGGMTDFEWMFEKDALGNKSGNYISPINYAEFYRQLKELYESLDKKYGKNATGIKATQKLAERNAWLKDNALSTFGKPMPKPDKWQNVDYIALSSTQKSLLDKFLKLKERFDLELPTSKRNTLRAVQIRKHLSQRIIDSGMSPSSIFSNIKKYYEEAFLDRIDDDQLFGTSSRGGITDFEGHEYMTLPILYTSILENPNELSTDVFGTLMQYAYMANNFSAMDTVVDALETGRDIVKQNRTVNSTRGNFPVIEKVKTVVGGYTKNIILDKSNIEQKLNDFFESQVYGRYLKDSGAFTVFGKSVNKSKLVSFLLNRSSMAQLGFNWLANTANVLTGSCMQRIEAWAGEYFSVKELAAADVEYSKLLGEFIPELGSRMKQSKLALFDELIDFKGDYRTRLSSVQKKNWVQRIFGENIAFIGQDGGDHWLYNRTAIAMAQRQKVNVPGKGVMSLWEALEIVESPNGGGLKKMILPAGTTTENGKPLDIVRWGRQVLHINQSLFGIYNDEDSNAANRIIMGRLLQQYRKWIKPQYNKRFQAAQQSLVMDGKIEEGYYRTLLRICNELVRGQVQLTNVWEQLNDSEKANVKRCITEFIQFFCVYLLASVIEWPDDRNRPWAIKFAEYSARRLQHELGGLTPSLGLAHEMLKNVKNPLPSVGVIQDCINLTGSMIDPRDWADELQSGPYKGMSTLEKNILKSPFKGIRQYRQISKFTDDIDTSILYYMRPY